MTTVEDTSVFFLIAEETFLLNTIFFLNIVIEINHCQTVIASSSSNRTFTDATTVVFT